MTDDPRTAHIPPRPPAPASAHRPSAPHITSAPHIPPRPPLPAPAPQAGAARIGWRDPRTWLVGYGVVLALIAFWPVPVDAGVNGAVRGLARLIPFLSYARIELVANVALFVPLGLLLTWILVRDRWLVMPIAFLSSVVIEGMQAIALERRAPTVLDIIANTAGACVGIVIAVVIERRRNASNG